MPTLQKLCLDMYRKSTRLIQAIWEGPLLPIVKKINEASRGDMVCSFSD